MERPTKLAQLRALTNRQLADLISARLDRGFACARVLAAGEAQAARAAGKGVQQRAEEAWREADRLLPALDPNAGTDRDALLDRARILREVLDQFAEDELQLRGATGS